MKKSERNNSAPLCETAQLYELEPDVMVDISAQAFEELRASLEKVEAMKKSVADGIAKAKEKDLKDHVEKFRDLLRKLVVMEKSLKDELAQKETAKLAFELDQLEAECHLDITVPDEKEKDDFVESASMLTSIRYGIAAKLVGFGGVFACLMGCILYLIFVQMDTMAVRFEWVWLIINFIGVILFTVLGLFLNGKSLYYADLAQEDIARFEAEKEKKAQNRAAKFSGIVAQAYAVELEKEIAEKYAEKQVEDTEELEEISKHGKILSVKKVKKGNADGVDVTVKGNPAMVFAAIASGIAAVAAVVATSCVKKKNAKEKTIEPVVQPKPPVEATPKLQGVFFSVQD